MTTFFGFAISDSMFSGDALIVRREISAENVPALLCAGYVSCLNPSHAATIAAAKARFGLELDVPTSAPKVELKEGDCLIVMGVRGLPRLGADRHEYTSSEVSSATFSFSAWFVEGPPKDNW